MITTKIVPVKNILSVSKLPTADFVINSYTGCPHKCQYCYAEFMRRFSGHAGEVWGDFLDVKEPHSPINLDKIKNKTVVLGSVTDPYNPYEAKFLATQNVLRELAKAEAEINIITKSDLITRDIDILQQFPKLTVAVSLNSLDEKFRQLFEPRAPSSQRRLNALAQLHAAGIHTTLFISPIFPGLTDVPALVQATSGKVDEFWIENLNLRGGYKPRILSLIKKNYPELIPLYHQIYVKKDQSFWENLSADLEKYFHDHALDYTNFFYHGKIRKN